MIREYQLANPAHTVPDLVHHIKDSGAKALVVGKAIIDVALVAAAECGIDSQNVFMIEEESYEMYRSIWTLLGPEELEPKHLSPEETKTRTAFMCYSSGTTGRAKGGQ